MVVRSYRYLIYFLVLILLVLIIAIFQLPDGNLHIVVCDVGQGDAILIVHKNIQILTDGGPDNKVLQCLGRYLPFWDRKIELVISTHPDSDHSAGLVDVIKKYNVDAILLNPVDPGTQVFEALKNEVGGRGVRVVNPTNGMVLGVDLIQLDILSEFDASKVETNFNSIVYEMEFRGFSGLFVGDIPPGVADELAGRIGPVNYIKIPHHGSANGLTVNLLKATMPGVAVISVGKKNMWGFPSQKILDLLNKYGVKILRTDLSGDVEVVTDGEKYWTK